MKHNTYIVEGFARHPALETPDRTFSPHGFFAIGLAVSPFELERLRRACSRLADPLAPGAATMPIRTEPTGRPFIIARTLIKPKVIVPTHLHPRRITRGDRVRMTADLSAYRTENRHGVRLTLLTAELLAADIARAA